jgi:hypothetical protein
MRIKEHLSYIDWLSFLYWLVGITQGIYLATAFEWGCK